MCDSLKIEYGRQAVENRIMIELEVDPTLGAVKIQLFATHIVVVVVDGKRIAFCERALLATASVERNGSLS